MLGHERSFVIVAQEAGGHGHGAAGIQNVHYRLAVVRRNFDGGVGPARRCSADEQRQLETLTLHLASHMDHLVERGRDKATEADHVRLHCFGAFEDLFAGDHHTHIDDLIVVAGEDDADNVLADVVNIALDGCENDLALRLDLLAGRCHRRLLGLHEGRQVRNGLLHHARGLDHLRQEHLASSEQITDHAHAGHQRAFDHQERAAQLETGFLGVDLDVGVDALDERVRETFLDCAVAPFFSFLFTRYRSSALQRFAKLHQPLCGVGTAIQQYVFDQHLQLGVDLLIDFEHSGIDDAHVRARRNGVVEEGGVHGLANLVIAAKAEGDVRDSAANFRMRQVGLDPARGVDEIDRVVVVLLHAGGDGEDIRIEDDVFGRKADLVDQDSIGALADSDLVFVGCGLALLVEGHHHHGGTVLEHGGSVSAEFFFAFLERDRVDDALALQALQTRLDDFPFRGVHHEGHLGNLGLARQQLQEARHGDDAIDHALVRSDVNDVGPVFDLLPGDANRFLVFPRLDQRRESGRTGYIGPLANHDEDAGLLGERLRSGEPERPRLSGLLDTYVIDHTQALTSLWRRSDSSAGAVPHLRGGWPSSALAMAAMCSGVLPQQPPAMLISPPWAKSRR